MIRSENKKRIWPIVLILFICVAATTFTLMNRLNLFMEDDKGAIDMAPANIGEAAAVTSDETGGTVQPEYNFEAGDDKTVWSSNTHVEMFKISYENGEKNLTVVSDNGEQVIAPGTDIKYTFKFKNTGDAAIDYTVDIDAYCTPDNIEIPVEAKVYRYDNEWIVGGSDHYGSVKALDSAKDSATLGAGRYTYYTLEWKWPFESGDDAYDTYLGNLAAQKDIVFTIGISTVATQSIDPYSDYGIVIPKTGDSTNMLLWGALIICSLMIILLLLFGRREKDE